MEKRIHLFHAMTHLRQNGFFGAERAVPFFCFRGCHVRVVV
jgi:RNA polymerase sporulation-specific sigma factor